MLSFDSAKRNFGTDEHQDDVLIEHTITRLGPDNKLVRLARDARNGIDEGFITLSL